MTAGKGRVAASKEGSAARGASPAASSAAPPDGERSAFAGRFPVELLTPTEMAEADRLAARAAPSFALMERAGEAVARTALTLLDARDAGSAAGHVLILCGPGNNGGDGYVAARLLADAGCVVTLASLVARESLVGDAARAAALWRGPVVDLATRGLASADLDATDLVVDALFGAGLTRDIAGPAEAAIGHVNAWADMSRRPVLAVDVPSGIDGATGCVRGAAVKASHTITFFRLKPGHILMPGRVHCGHLHLADIGIAASVLDAVAPKTRLNVPALWPGVPPRPRLDGHKYGRGHAVVVSGPLGQTGAARLCAHGALRAGAGLVTVASPPDALAVLASALTAVMTRVSDGADGLAALLEDARKNAVALGPGLGVGAGARAQVRAALAASPAGGTSRAVVIDADALVSFAAEPDVLFAAISEGGHAVVLTPHDGEFAKLFPDLAASGSKLERTRAAAVLCGAVVLLKGPDTVVAHPDGRASIAASEAPWLATAGSGDVLAGMVAGLLAQGVPAFEAASSAVWMHAEAARLFGPGLISEDIPDVVPRVLAALFGAVAAS